MKLVKAEDRKRKAPCVLMPLSGGFKYYIYRHVRLDKNEPFYIGVSKLAKQRNQYARARSRDRTKKWHEIVNKTKYRIDIVFETDSFEEAIEKEKEFIALYGRQDLEKGSLINLSDGGLGPTNYILSEEAKQKISIKASLYRHTQESKNKISERALERGYKSEVHVCSKATYQYSIDGNFIKKWGCLRDAEKETGITAQHIGFACTKTNHHAGGFYWYFEDRGLTVPVYKVVFTKPVIQTDEKGQEIQKFKSCQSVAISLFSNKNIKNAIRLVCMGKYANYKGLYFKYQEA